MSVNQVVLLLLLPLCFAKSDVTFKNVTFRGYSVFTEKFKKVIPASNSLKDFLPESTFDMIEFRDQNIPVLYEDSLSNLDELDELIIESCSVYEIRPGALKNVPLLRRLSLKANKIEEIKGDIFNNLPLSTLDLSKNRITTISPTAFDYMSSLLNINLADNQISVWNPSWFKNTPLLTRISMQNNSITVIPEQAFHNLEGEKKFGKIDLSINLIFSYNKIEKIHPQAFSGLKKINNLWLDHNSIEEFDGDLLKGVAVKELRLNYNQIKCPTGDLSEMFRAELTSIDVNPLDCDCLETIKDWKKKTGKHVELFYADMECTTQRIKKKMTALEERIKEIRSMDKETVTNVDLLPAKPIK
ncbi:unnamed protein product [Phaedon cochleariae]|uniref:Uncharacterized protein n=1 Tax=Phaedon cochleariae TaxID=80249 RepID=A0A9P0DIH8_PHACE|nr:unnamed protein product [Phaedon cochleariae]